MSTTLATFQGSALDAQNYAHSIEIAARLAKSDMLPAHFKGKPENVLLVYALAQQLDVNPIMALQKCSVIGGKPCLSADFMIALLNQRGLLRGPLRFRWDGNPTESGYSCVAYGVDAATGETVESEPVTLALAQAEGWTRNPKYKTMPTTMLKWRAASFFIRTYYPQVVMGMHSAEEIEDVQASPRDVTPQSGSARERLAALRASQAAPEAFQTGNGAQGEPATSAPEDAAPHANTPPDPPPAPEPEAVDEVLSDFLLGVSEATDAGELTQMVEQANGFEEAGPQKIAKRAIMVRAKALGLEWHKGSNAFVTGGDA